MLSGVTIILRSRAPTPTAIPAPIPARNPPLGRENPRGAQECSNFLPKLCSNETASQKPPITAAATNESSRTTESSASCESAICASNVDVFRDPFVASVLQEPFLYGGRQKLDLPQLLDTNPTYPCEGRLGAGGDLGVTPQTRLPVSFQSHPRDDVDRMALLPQELAHVEDTGEAGREACLLSEFAARATGYRLARL